MPNATPSRRRIAWLVGAVGLAVAIALVVRAGAPAVFGVLARGGWLLLLIVPIHVIVLALDARGWRPLLTGTQVPSSIYLAGVAIVREALSTLLPGRIGGELVGIRMLMRRGIPMVPAAASVVVEVTLWLVAQLLFAVAGLVILATLPSAGDVPRYAAVGLLVISAAVALFVALQRHIGMFGLLQRLLRRVAGETVAKFFGSANALDAAIATIYRDVPALASSVAWVLASFVVAAFETWVALRVLGESVGFGAAVVIESLTLLVQSAAFLVPAGLGAQEAILLLLCAAVGVPAPAALALAITRRGRQIILGIPAVIAWFWTERHGAT